MRTYRLILLDDDLHTEQQFANAIARTFPDYNHKIIRIMCRLIHRGGSATCTHGPLERIEHYQTTLNRLGFKTVLEELN